MSTIQNSPVSSPEREIEALIEEARGRQRRRRRRIAIVLVALIATAVVALDGAGGSHRPRPRDPVVARRSPQGVILRGADTTLMMWPAGAPVFGDLPGGGSGTTVRVDNLNTGTVSVRRIPNIAGGDFPYQIVAVGRWLVYNGDGGVSRIGDDLAGPPRVLGAAAWFVPSVHGNILLVRRAANSATPISVRSVSVATGARGPVVTLPRGTDAVDEGTARGLLLQVSHGRSGSALELWQPHRPLTKFAGVPYGNGVALDARTFAYGSHCTPGYAKFANGLSGFIACARLHLLNLLSGRRTSFPAPAGTIGWLAGGYGVGSTFAPHELMIAAQAVITPARAGQARLFVLRLDGRSTPATAVPDSAAPLYARTAWSTRGSWLFYQGPGARLRAFQLSGRTEASNVRCCGYTAVVSVPGHSQ